MSGNVAGGAVPADRRIDGADLSGLLLGQTTASPREAHYYFSGNRLEAVRRGPWKLAVAPQSEGIGKPKEPETQFTPRLYNLEADIGETTDVAAGHPEIVKQLQQLVAKMDADLGAAHQGPGVRASGRVVKPQPLLLKK